jgi:hypothetical protein
MATDKTRLAAVAKDAPPLEMDPRWERIRPMDSAPVALGLQDDLLAVPEPAKALVAVMRQAQVSGSFIGPGSHLHDALGEMLATAYLGQTL